MRKPYPPVVQTPNFYTVESDPEAQTRFDSKPRYSPQRVISQPRKAFVYKPPRLRSPEETQYHRDLITQHPDFDKQMLAMCKVMGKENAELYLARVLDNLKYAED